MTPLEKAARAVQETVVGCCNPNEREALDIARAVLMAVREPDEGMIEAVENALEAACRSPLASDTIEMIHGVLIDHTLRGGETG